MILKERGSSTTGCHDSVMKRRDYFFLAFLGLAVVLVVAAFQSAPGYMDADYYFQGGQRLAQGAGFDELLLWNFLDDPEGIPHPSHAYWMPLTSIIAWLGMAVTGTTSFAAARLGFLALAALLPPVTAGLSQSINRQRRPAMLSGLLAVFCAFYLSYLPTSDIFGFYMLFGAAFLIISSQVSAKSVGRPVILASSAFLLGLISGAMHLSRADGLLWLALALGVLVFRYPRSAALPWYSSRAALCIICLLGYLLVMGSWMMRNIQAFGAPLAPGGGGALWITSYDELFIYPASLLTPSRWLETGLAAILQARLWAAGQNLQTALGVQGAVFLAPLILAGAWQLRRDATVRLAMLAWCLIFLVMTLVFPFQGARGGFFHSGSALQPLFWALVPPGLEVFLAWAGRLRGWNIPQARHFFQGGLVVLALLLSVLIVSRRVVGDDLSQPAWDAGFRHYVALETELQELGASGGETVLVNNSPGYFVASGRPAISIPYGDAQTVLDVAERYQARYLLLELDQVQGPENLYNDPGDHPGLRYLGSYQNTRIYAIGDE
jgi:hypothetical protein